MSNTVKTNAPSGSVAIARWRMGALSLGALAAATAVLTGCTAGVTGKATPAMQPAVAAPELADEVSTATTTTNPTRPRPAPPKPANAPGKTSAGAFDAAIGDCVTLEGTTAAPQIAHAVCGSSESNFKVVDKAPTHQECIADADMWYANTLNGSEVGALCLDVDWIVGGCVETSGDWPARIDCAAGTSDIVRVVRIVEDADDASVCAGGEGGVYSERKVVVCVEPV